MKLICQIEGCGHLSENRDIGLCATHAREARKKAAPKAKPARKRIAKQSEEGKERMAVYNGIRKLYMEVNMICRAHPECFPSEKLWTVTASEVHHMKGRDGDLLYDVRFWLPVCRRCHERITLESEWAYNEGLSLSRHQTETI